ncbi:hypothetical protein KC345_g7008 [Hortaea werneckii]|nr:hypothetical protein KC345_g7008 [Hortaea werneckii]
MARKRSWLALGLSLLMLLSPFTALGRSASAAVEGEAALAASSSQADSYIRFKNEWKGTYLYEAAGKVRYGFTAVNDPASQWLLEKSGEITRIKNRATGHYLSMENGVNDGGTPLAAKTDNGAESMKWIVSTADAGSGEELAVTATIHSASYAAAYLNVQVQDGYAYSNGWAQPGWGSARWKLEPASDSEPVRIRDSWKGNYLYEQDGKVLYGTPLLNDASSHWYMVSNPDGTSLIRNRMTGHYVRMNNDPGDGGMPLAAGQAAEDMAPASWKLAEAKDGGGNPLPGRTTVQSAVYGDVYFNVQTQDGYAYANTWAQPTWESAQWTLEAASDAQAQRVQEKWKGTFLYEENGQVKYGTPDYTDTASQWAVEDAGEGFKQLRNVATGHYASMNNDAGDGSVPLASSGGLAAASALWVMAPAMDGDGNTLEGYVTLRSSLHSDVYINVQSQNGYAYANTWAQSAWGSAAWRIADPQAGGGTEEPVNPYIRIKNDWLQLYLYEGNGKVLYGNVAAADEQGQWQVESTQGIKRIKNRATGHYISLEGVENSRTALTAADISGGSTLADWIVDTYQGHKLIRSAAEGKDTVDSGNYINVENKLKAAQYGTVAKDWGSPKWDFITVTPDTGSTSKYVRLKNGYRNSYLYEESGIVKDGQPAADDAASHWSLEQGDKGTLIVNRKTGHVISSANVQSYADALESTDADRTLASSAWTVEAVSGSEQKVFSSAVNADIVIHDEDNRGFAQASNLDKSWGSAHWALEAAPQLPPVMPDGYIRIKSASGGQYLYENRNHVVLYGQPAAEDGYSHWSVETLNGVQQFKNRATGDLLSIEHLRGYAEASAAGEATAGSRSDWVVESAQGSDALLIRSAAEGHEDEYLHIQDALGYAQYDLRSVESAGVQWKFETAAQEVILPPDPSVGMTSSTPVLADRNTIRLSSQDGEGGYLIEADGMLKFVSSVGNTPGSIWRLEDKNGHVRLRNEATGHLAALNTGGGTAVQTDAAADTAAEWIAKEYAGYLTLENAAMAGHYLNLTGEAVAGGAMDAAEVSAHWSVEPVNGNTIYEAEDAFMSGGAHPSLLARGFTGSGFAAGFGQSDARLIYAVTAPEEGSYGVKLRYANTGGSPQNMALYINGVLEGIHNLSVSGGIDEWDEYVMSVKLQAGLNTLLLKPQTQAEGIAVDSLTVSGTSGPSFRGATLPYITYEAEQGHSNAEPAGPSTDFKTMASEASGRAAVNLSRTGDFVEFGLKESANFMTLRYAIPDAAAGGGTDATLTVYVNGVKSGKMNLSSEYAWVYGKYPWSNDPAEGDGHRFFDESQTFLGDLPAGAVIRLQKDADDNAEYYMIDLAELETAPDAYTMPGGYLSVAGYGAVADDGADDSAAFAAAIREAQQTGKGVWVPQGVFRFADGPLDISNVTIRGAGMWYSVIEGAGFMGTGSNIQVYDLKLDVGVTSRQDSQPEAAFDGTFGRNSILQGLWIERAKVGVWSTMTAGVPTDGLYIAGLRIRNTYADGINLTTGTVNSMVEQTQIRGSGDDSIALWSQVPDTLTGTPEEISASAKVANNTVRFNSVQLPWLADGIAVFGGSDNRVQDNLISDTIVSGAGIAVSTRFNPVSFGGTTVIERNTLLRTGSHEFNWNQDFGGIWIFVDQIALDGDIEVRNNNVLDSTFQGLYISGPNTVHDGRVNIQDLVIDGSGTWGINAAQGVSGSVVLDNVILRNNKVGNIFNGMAADFSLIEANRGITQAVKSYELALDGKTGERFTLSAGQSAELTAVKPLAAGTGVEDVTADTTFEISDPSVARLDSDGVLTALAPGIAVITAEYAGNVVHYTLVVPDTEGPVWANGELEASAITSSSLRLDWPAAADGAGAGVIYRLSFGGRSIATAAAFAEVPGLVPSTSYTFLVEAMDLAGNWSRVPLKVQAATSSAPPDDPGTPAGPGTPPNPGTPVHPGATATPPGDTATFQAGTAAQNDNALKSGAAGGAELIIFTADNASGAVSFTTAGWRDAFAGGKAGTVRIVQGDASYELPWNILDLLKRSGYEADADGSVLTVKISAPAAADAAKVSSFIAINGRKLAGQPVSFGLSLAASGKVSTISQFGGAFIKRSFKVEGILDPAASAVVVLDPATGNLRYASAVITPVNGATVITVRSMTNSVYAAASGAVTFGDVSGHWARKDIEALASQGMIKGRPGDVFDPDSPVTRAEFASLLMRSIGADQGIAASDKQHEFSDVAPEAWYADEVTAASSLGVIRGFAGGIFHPGDEVTREQMAVMLAGVLKLDAETVLPAYDKAELDIYRDKNGIASWASEAVTVLTQTGIIGGRSSGLFAPQDKVTRAEAATVLNRLLGTMKLH